MRIQFSAIKEPENWLKMIAEQLGRVVVNGEVNIPANYGEGVFKEFYPMKWLTISYLKFKMKESVEMERLPVENAPYLPIMFYMDNVKTQIIGDDIKDVGLHTSDGIFMPSSEIESKWVLPANKWITNLTLTFDKTWLIEQLGKENYICDLLASQKSFYLFESFTPSIFDQIQTIESCIGSKENTMKLHLYSESMKLFALFIDLINKRPENKSFCGIHASDVNNIFKVRKLLLDNVCNPPHIADLAKEAGMSPTKLQNCFKQIFGKNIIQYALEKKMELAKQLLESRQYAVSEVGYQLGYSNLSHFSKAFYKHFQITPKAFQSSI